MFFSHETAATSSDAVAGVIERNEIAIVLAGDCSVILGGLLGARLAMGSSGLPDRVGLLFIDGHVDFYQPEASPTGEAADMDLALATGRGPEILTTFDGRTPLVRDEDIAAVGARDRDEREKVGSQDIRDSGIRLLELASIRERGIDAVAEEPASRMAPASLVPVTPRPQKSPGRARGDSESPPTRAVQSRWPWS